MEIVDLTANEIARNVRERELTAAEVRAAFRDRLAALDGDVGAFLAVNDRDDDAPAEGPLAGVPIAIKDNLCTDWLPTTAGSRVIENYRPPYNATVVDRLLNAGAYVLGKTNLDEFGMGSSTEYSAFFPTKNPRDLTRVPGGSSGGSAAAVCAGFAPVALGTDTGGSIRQPAAMCGVVGLKPTYGRVSRYGLISFAPSFDQIGPLGRSVADVALVAQVLAGSDPREATSRAEAVPDYVAGLDRNLGPLRIGVIEEFYGTGEVPDPDAYRETLSGAFGKKVPAETVETIIAQTSVFFEEGAIEPGTRKALDGALAALRGLGHTVEPVGIPSAAWALPTYYVAVCAETYSNLARYQAVLFGPRAEPFDGPADMVARARAQGFGAEVKRRIVAGAYVLSVGYRDAYYGKAQTVRHHLRQRFAQVLEDYDFLLSPVSPFTAFELNTRNLDPQLMYLADIFSSLPNLVGFPALTLPCGFDERSLPVGLHLIARPWAEDRLLAFAHQLEAELGLPRAVVTPRPPA